MPFDLECSLTTGRPKNLILKCLVMKRIPLCCLRAMLISQKSPLLILSPAMGKVLPSLTPLTKRMRIMSSMQRTYPKAWLNLNLTCELSSNLSRKRRRFVNPKFISSSSIYSPVAFSQKPKQGELRQTINDAHQVTPALGIQVTSAKHKKPADSK